MEDPIVSAIHVSASNEDLESIKDRVTSSLKAAVSVMGPLPMRNLNNLKSTTTSLGISLRQYDRKAESLLSSTPSKKKKKDDIDKIIKSRYPTSGKGYTDKMYKMTVLRFIHRLNPFLNKRYVDKKEIIDSSVASLTFFKLVGNIIIAFSRRLVDVGREGQELAPSVGADQDFDPELHDVLEGLGQTTTQRRPTATDQHQRDTEVAVNRSTRSVTPSGQATDTEEYQAKVNSYQSIISNAVSSIRLSRRSIIESLDSVDPRTFTLVNVTAKRMNDLAKEYGKGADEAAQGLYPGSYVACKAFSSMLEELGSIVVEAGAPTDSSRKLEPKRTKALDTYLKTTKSESETD